MRSLFVFWMGGASAEFIPGLFPPNIRTTTVLSLARAYTVLGGARTYTVSDGGRVYTVVTGV